MRVIIAPNYNLNLSLMETLQKLFDKNVAWADRIKQKDPDFFAQLAKQQSPEYLWIGCADSRVPANEIVGLLPGELFVHRNIANCVVHTDLNCLSVVYYAIQVLKVKHIIVCGHYGCGGVEAAMKPVQVGLPDHWIRNIRDVYFNRREELQSITDPKEKSRRLCELNVMQQASNLSHISVVQNAWDKGQELSLHGWIYDIQDGLLKRLIDPITSIENVSTQYRLV